MVSCVRWSSVGAAIPKANMTSARVLLLIINMTKLLVDGYDFLNVRQTGLRPRQVDFGAKTTRWKKKTNFIITMNRN